MSLWFHPVAPAKKIERNLVSLYVYTLACLHAAGKGRPPQTLYMGIETNKFFTRRHFLVDSQTGIVNYRIFRRDQHVYIGIERHSLDLRRPYAEYTSPKYFAATKDPRYIIITTVRVVVALTHPAQKPTYAILRITFKSAAAYDRRHCTLTSSLLEQVALTQLRMG